MPEVTIIFWRDIPAQVRIGRGRKAARAILSERFEQAIDRVAMKIGATDGDAYTKEWRDSIIEAQMPHDEASPKEIVQAHINALEKQFDTMRLKQLIDNDGFDPK